MPLDENDLKEIEKIVARFHDLAWKREYGFIERFNSINEKLDKILERLPTS